MPAPTASAGCGIKYVSSTCKCTARYQCSRIYFSGARSFRHPTVINISNIAVRFDDNISKTGHFQVPNSTNFYLQLKETRRTSVKTCLRPPTMGSGTYFRVPNLWLPSHIGETPKEAPRPSARRRDGKSQSVSFRLCFRCHFRWGRATPEVTSFEKQRPTSAAPESGIWSGFPELSRRQSPPAFTELRTQ